MMSKSGFAVDAVVSAFDILFSEDKAKASVQTLASLAVGSIALLIPGPVPGAIGILIAAGSFAASYVAG